MIKSVFIIKNMHDANSNGIVENLLNEMGIPFIFVEEGKIALSDELQPEKKRELSKNLKSLGFQLLEGIAALSVERIKDYIIEWDYKKDLKNKGVRSEFFSEKLCCTYDYISTFFKKETGIKISEFSQNEKIRRAKNMLRKRIYTIEDVADALNFSSREELCKVFKEITAQTPAQFRKDFWANEAKHLSIHRKQLSRKKYTISPKMHTRRR